MFDICKFFYIFVPVKRIFIYLSVLFLAYGCVSIDEKDSPVVEGRYNHEFLSRIDHFIDENGDTLHYGANDYMKIHIAGTYKEQIDKRVEKYSNVAYWLSRTDSDGVKTTKSHITMLSEGCLETVVYDDGGASGRILFMGDYIYVTVTPKEDGVWCSFRIKRK